MFDESTKISKDLSRARLLSISKRGRTHAIRRKAEAALKEKNREEAERRQERRQEQERQEQERKARKSFLEKHGREPDSEELEEERFRLFEAEDRIEDLESGAAKLRRRKHRKLPVQRGGQS